MNSGAPITVSTQDAIALVTLDRPAKRNAMTLAMWKQIAAVFTMLGDDRTVRAIILTGAGGHFSVGADVAEFAQVRENRDQSIAYEIDVDAAADAIAAVPQPVIAVVEGYCLGGGNHLALPCDFRFAHTNATFGIPAAKLSIVYGVRSTQRLLSLVGLSAAKRLLYTAAQIDAPEALNIGLIDQTSDDPMQAALRLARTVSTMAPLSIGGAKQILTAHAMAGTQDADALQALIDAASDSADYREGRAAFAQKRAPDFKGR